MNARAAAAAALVVLIGAVACSRAHDRVERPALRSVSLPDLSRASESVKTQLREAHAAVTQTSDAAAGSGADRAAAYGRLGMLLMAAEYRDQAEACLINAQTLAAGDVRWPYYLAHLYKAMGDTSKSAASFERALHLRPTDPATLVWLGEAYLDQGRPDAAAPLFERALAAQPRSVSALFGLGRAALAKRDYARAVGHLEQALALDRGAAPVVHYQLALAYRELGDAEKADRHLRQRGPGEIRPPDPLMQELESALESPVAYEVRGARALDARDWTAAAAHFRKGIAFAPSEPSLRHKLGTALFMAGDARGAADEFEAALRLSPTFVKAHYSLGVLMGSTGRTDKAIEHLAGAVKSDPTYVDARLRLADVLRSSGRPADALPQYEEAARLDPRASDAPLGAVMALATLDRYPEARDRVKQGMQQHPDRPAFAHLLVRLLAAAPDDRVRDGREAMRLMQELLAKEPRGYALDEMMAMTSAELGQYGEAVTWQREAIEAAKRAGRFALAERMTESLARYEHRQPCRTPWRDDDPPAAG